jgi:hypothetical protein
MLRRGLTFEANLGLALMRFSADDMSSDTERALGGLDLGFGGWLSDRLALTLRFAGGSYRPEEGVRRTSVFVGPSVQLWTNDHFWVGGGLGFAVASVTVEDGPDLEDDSGLGLDLRLGYTFNPASEHTFNVSVEYTPGFFSVDTGVTEQEFTLSTFGVLLGYQHL